MYIAFKLRQPAPISVYKHPNTLETVTKLIVEGEEPSHSCILSSILHHAMRELDTPQYPSPYSQSVIKLGMNLLVQSI